MIALGWKGGRGCRAPHFWFAELPSAAATKVLPALVDVENTIVALTELLLSPRITELYFSECTS